MKGKIAERAEQDVLIEMKDNSKRNVKKEEEEECSLSQTHNSKESRRSKSSRHQLGATMNFFTNVPN